MRTLATTPPTPKKTHSPRSPARTKPRAAITRRKEMTPEEFAAAAAKLGPEAQALLAVFDKWEKAHPGYSDWAWPRLKAAMERNNGRTRKIFAD
jgi:hypothetical protein